MTTNKQVVSLSVQRACLRSMEWYGVEDRLCEEGNRGHDP